MLHEERKMMVANLDYRAAELEEVLEPAATIGSHRKILQAFNNQ
jgi:hypothetical protein